MAVKKSLAALIKLQKSYVDEQRRHVAQLQDRLEKIERDIAQLEIAKAREQEAARDPAASYTYGEFVKRAVAQGRELEEMRRTAAGAVAVAQDRLAALFEEQKRYEIAEKQRIDDEAREALRRENIELDEIGGVMHERGKDGR